MKKISILVVAMAMMVSCGYKTKTIALENEADSVNYAMGLMLMSNCQDSTEEGIKEFLDAVKAGHNGEWEDMPQTEMAGLSIGLSAQQYVSDGLAGRPDMTFNGNIFFQALVNTWNGDTTTFPASQIMPFWMKAMQSPAPQGIEYEAVVGSCPTESAEVELKNYFDSLNYVFGAVHTQQLKQQLPMMDTITKEEDRLDVLVKAINKGINTKMYSVPTYMGGRQLGLSIRKVEQDTTGLKDFGGIAVNFDIMFQAMINGLNDYEEMMSVEEAEQYLRELSLTKLFGDWKKHVGLSIASAVWRKTISFSRRFALQPMFYGRMVFGTDTPPMLSNFIGGATFGRYFEQQMPFAGIGNVEPIENMFVAASLKSQVRLTDNNYVQARVAVGEHGGKFNELFDEKLLFGVEAAYYYRTILGPVGGSLGWSNRTNCLNAYVNLGFDF